MTKTALVVGASGIVGSATATLLVDHGWRVHGLARRPTQQDGVLPVAADLQDAAATQAALADLRPDAVFITTWLRQDSEGMANFNFAEQNRFILAEERTFLRKVEL